MSNSEEWDTIIIGSGMAQLTLASLLSRFLGEKVLILEQHYLAGGFTHAFSRSGRFKWDVGIHYVGEMQKYNIHRQLFDLIVDSKVKWQAMPEVFDKFVYPGFSFSERAGLKNFQSDLILMFPDEQRAIKKYFRDLKKVFAAFSINLTARKLFPVRLANLIPKIPSRGNKLTSLSTADYLNQNFKSEKLKALLTSQIFDMGLSPTEYSFAVQSILVLHYIEGGFYPEGTGSSIASSIKSIIEPYGAMIRTNHEVEEILIENNCAVGVRTKLKKGNSTEVLEFHAKQIVSGAGAKCTFLKLLPKN